MDHVGTHCRRIYSSHNFFVDLPPIVVPLLMLVPLTLLSQVPVAYNPRNYVDELDYIPFSIAQSIPLLPQEW